jgi:hypothetical protein
MMQAGRRDQARWEVQRQRGARTHVFQGKNDGRTENQTDRAGC